MMEHTFFVLLWTSNYTVPFSFFKDGRKSFIDKNCEFQNCYFTNNKSHFEDLRNFDVILFNIANLSSSNLPERRSSKQKYVLVITDPAFNISSDYNHVFNLTWTYRLDSDIPWPNMVITDVNDTVFGPSRDMHWIPSEVIKEASKHFEPDIDRKKTVAFVTSNCDVRSDKDDYVVKLDKALRVFGHSVDKYRMCGDHRIANDCYVATENGTENLQRACKKCNYGKTQLACDKEIQLDYYFHLVFEDYFREDYVSPNLLFALERYSMPVVFGGADYSRFMPDDVYINAQDLTPEGLADKIIRLTRNEEVYNELSMWRNYYTYLAPEDNPHTDPVCQFCAFLNNNERMKNKSVYGDIVSWYHGHVNKSKSYRISEIQLVNLQNFSYKLNSYVCKTLQLPFIRIVISAVTNFERRNVLRQIWGNDTHDSIVFMLGDPFNENITIAIREEHIQYDDIVQGSFFDSYKNLTYKHIMALHWATTYCPNARYILKTDDDVFVNAPVAKKMVAKATVKEYDILCVPNTGLWVVRNEFSKFFVSRKEYAEDRYPQYCVGALVIYSARVAPLLVAAARTEPYLFVDDAYVTGILRQKLNLTTKEISQRYLVTHYANPELLPKEAREQFLFVHGLSAMGLMQFWKTIKEEFPFGDLTWTDFRVSFNYD